MVERLAVTEMTEVRFLLLPPAKKSLTFEAKPVILYPYRNQPNRR